MLSGIVVVFFFFLWTKRNNSRSLKIIKWFLEVPLATPQVSSILIS